MAAILVKVWLCPFKSSVPPRLVKNIPAYWSLPRELSLFSITLPFPLARYILLNVPSSLRITFPSPIFIFAPCFFWTFRVPGPILCKTSSLEYNAFQFTMLSFPISIPAPLNVNPWPFMLYSWPSSKIIPPLPKSKLSLNRTFPPFVNTISLSLVIFSWVPVVSALFWCNVISVFFMVTLLPFRFILWL